VYIGMKAEMEVTKIALTPNLRTSRPSMTIWKILFAKPYMPKMKPTLREVRPRPPIFTGMARKSGWIAFDAACKAARQT